LHSIDKVYEILLKFGPQLVLHQEESNNNDKIYKTKVSNFLNFLKSIFSEFFKSDDSEKFFKINKDEKCEFRWMDLFHAPYNYPNYNLIEFTVHFRNEKMYANRIELISKAWNWFKGGTKGDQFSLTPLIFVDSTLPKLLLITNDNKQKATPVYDVIVFKSALLSNSNCYPLEQGAESNSQADDNLKNKLENKKEELKKNGEFQNLCKDIEELLQLKDSNVNKDGLAKYIVLTTIFESDIIKEEKNFYYYYFPAMPGKKTVLSGSILAVAGKKGLSLKIISRFDFLINIWSRYAHQAETERKIKIETDRMNIRIAITAILVDSFAHNISAHSLHAITWLYKKRQALMEKKFVNKGLSKNEYKILKEDIDEIIKKISGDYKELGKEYYNEYFNLFDLFKNIKREWGNGLLAFNELPTYALNNKNPNKNQTPRFPVPLDNEILLYLKYIQGKASFWSGVLKDATFGGEIKTIYDILFEFSWNPLFLGTIADSEGINIVEINIGLKKSNEKNGSEDLENFITIDITALMKDNKDKEKKNPFKYIDLGEKYSTLRNELSNYPVFLPGGVVGKHALYTLFENTIRNVKHVKKNIKGMEKIVFNIRIEELDDKVFRFTICLGNETDLAEKDVKNLSEYRSKSIISTSGRPKLGGSSQDKICAAMLFTGRFTNVENREYIYKSDNVEVRHPWIYIHDVTTTDKIVKRSLHLWRGDIYIKLDSDSDLENENVSRFNFAILPKGSTLSARKIYENGLMRLLNLEFLSEKCTDENDKKWIKVVENSKTLPPKYDASKIKPFLYKFWNQVWIKNNNIQRIFLAVWISLAKQFVIEKKNSEWTIEKARGKNVSENDKVIGFAHGSELEGRESLISILECKSQGVLWEKFQIIIRDRESISEAKEKGNVHEFIESLLTKILIIDNRIHERISEMKKEKLYKDNLFLDIYDEYQLNAEKLKLTLEQGEYNFIILHLSYIESLNGYDERNLEFFIKTFFTDCKLDDQTKLVITTGRGRELWTGNIEEEYIKHITLKPIDMLLDAIEDGLLLKDDFSVKYNLVKILFGS
jgi:hypothetical protein